MISLHQSTGCQVGVVQASAVFGTEHPVGSTRYELRRWWVEKPASWASVLMLNPSAASQDRDDPTSRQVTGLVRAIGLDGWIGVNLYPFISSRPGSLSAWIHNEHWRDAMKANLSAVERAGRIAVQRFAAWGAFPVDEPWLEQALEAYTQPQKGADHDPRLWCWGTTAQGWPLHPLARGKHRIPPARRPILWTRP